MPELYDFPDPRSHPTGNLSLWMHTTPIEQIGHQLEASDSFQELMEQLQPDEVLAFGIIHDHLEVKTVYVIQNDDGFTQLCCNTMPHSRRFFALPPDHGGEMLRR